MPMGVPEPYPFPAPFDDAAKAERALKKSDPAVWQKKGEKAVLALFKKASERVPAYKDFLKKHRVQPSSVRTVADISKLPTVNKDNYLRKYPMSALSWDGKLMDAYQVYASTSGSTGAPFYFPRGQKQTDQYALLAELYLRSQYKIHERSTLYVDCFAMGAWIGGLFTFQAIERLAKSGRYPLHLITPGLSKDEAVSAVRNLGPRYDQVIIGGYPPYVKDLIDYGAAAGLDWKRYRIKFVFSAEGFSEKFRDHVAKAAGQENVLRDSLNHYGTADMGTMAYETPLAASLRRAALADTTLFKDLFGQANRLPTLAQYLPEHFYFEQMNGGLVCSADSGLPLIRYDLRDQGGIIGFSEAVSAAEKSAPGYVRSLGRDGIADTVFKLPFAYLYERADFGVVLYGATIFPEHIRNALESRTCERFATGKCAVRIIESRSHEPRLEVNVELKRGASPSLLSMRMAEREITASLLEHNSEYAIIRRSVGEKARPRIRLLPFGTPGYFSGGGKQKWIIK